MPVIYAKKHMRHSDLKLTNRYMDDSQLAISEELKRLPRIYDERTQIRAQISGPEGQIVAQTDANGDGEDDENSPGKMGLDEARPLLTVENLPDWNIPILLSGSFLVQLKLQYSFCCVIGFL